MKTAVEFIFDAVYRDMPYPELLGVLAEAKIIEKQQQGYSEEKVLSIVHVSCEEGMYIQRTINDKVSIPAKRIKDFQNKILENYKNR